MDYATLDSLLVGRCKASKKLGNNTYAIRHNNAEGSSIFIRLHTTEIMTFDKSGSVSLNTGGWRTVTTKQRLNEYLPAGWRISQDKGLWYVCWQGKRICLFDDGLTVNDNGGIAGGLAIDTMGPKIRNERKQARKYAKDFIAALVAGDVPLPSGGDCWCCLMRDTATGKPAMPGRDHIIGHMEEAYYVPSLLVNACEMFGASHVARAFAHEAMSGRIAFVGAYGDIAIEQLTRVIYRYVLRQLGHVT